MPTFPKPAPIIATRLAEFIVRVTVLEDPSGVQLVAFGFSATTATADPIGAVDHLAGDLAPYLSPAQITAFTNAVTALQAKAKAELIA